MADQLSLFPSSALTARSGDSSVVGPAPASDDVRMLARQLPRGLRLGTSSWFFPGWHGIVWDRPTDETTLSREGLRAYSAHPLFSTVCVDRTFYAPLERGQFSALADQVPDDFRFVVKAPASCTQSWLRSAAGKREPNPTFLDAECVHERFIAPCLAGLGDKAGALLFQFPPLGRAVLRERGRFIERLHALLKALPTGPLYAVEVRDAALLTRRFFAAIRDAGAQYCVGVHPKMPAVAVQAAAMAGAGPAPLVVRWNLNPRELDYDAAKARYAPFDRLVDEDESTRESIARLVAAPLKAGEPAFVIVNNKAEGSAPLSIEKLAASIVAAREAAE